MSAAELDGVARTMLWTLYCRAHFAERGEIDDPHAVRIRDGLDLDLSERFGPPDSSFARRARLFDARLAEFLGRRPGATVVSLGEGLETQRFRVSGYGRWVTVDLPDVIHVRERYITADDHHRHVAGSALDPTWQDDLPEGPTIVIAQGLFMYLSLIEVESLVRRTAHVADRLVFDVVPSWVSRVTRLRLPLAPSFRLPTMPWGANRRTLTRLLSSWLGAKAQVDLHSYPLPSGPMPFALRSLVADVSIRRQ